MCDGQIQQPISKTAHKFTGKKTPNKLQESDASEREKKRRDGDL